MDPLTNEAVVELRLYWGKTPQARGEPVGIIKLRHNSGCSFEVVSAWAEVSAPVDFAGRLKILKGGHGYDGSSSSAKSLLERVGYALTKVTESIYDGLFYDKPGTYDQWGTDMLVEMRLMPLRSSVPIIQKWVHRRKIDSEALDLLQEVVFSKAG